ncbi:MAG TPA: hypothetical protein VKZ72_07415 [Acidimicrobiales bacterium]|nr:hypothetical protein [Acidimicrobiales bacterium]
MPLRGAGPAVPASPHRPCGGGEQLLGQVEVWAEAHMDEVLANRAADDARAADGGTG